MLVIGIEQTGVPIYYDLDIDIDVDSPRCIHDLLMKKAGGRKFEHIICVDGDTVVAEYANEEDYDLSVNEQDDDNDMSDDTDGDDDLHEDIEDEDE